MPPIVSFIGFQDSGKTTVCVDVISSLKELGYTVAVIKSSSVEKATFDIEGKDTHKYKNAGADSVMFVGPDQMVLQSDRKDELSLHTLAHRYFPEADIVIGEGFKHARQIPKIEVLRDKSRSLKGEASGIIAIVTDLDVAGDNIFRPHERKELAQFIEKRFLKEGSRENQKAALLVNGQKIHINRFIQNALAGSVAGLVSSLKLKEEVSDIELRIKL